MDVDGYGKHYLNMNHWHHESLLNTFGIFFVSVFEELRQFSPVLVVLGPSSSGMLWDGELEMDDTCMIARWVVWT